MTTGPELGLEGRVALVTGASSGIGMAVAEHLASLGADIAVSARRADRLEQIGKRIRALDRRALVLPADLAGEDAGHRLVSGVVDDWHRLDIVINCAGVLSAYPTSEMRPSDWDAILAVNLRAAVFLSQAATAAMQLLGSHGSIVAIGSSLAGGGGAGMEGVDYNVSKVGLQAWTKTFAREVGPLGIRVNCVACGAIDTPMHAAWREALIAEWTPKIPLRRIGTPREVACAVAFLVSDAAAYITGQTLHVNGGLQGSYS